LQELPIPLELREKLFPLTLLEFTSLLKPITTDVNGDTPVAWSFGIVELTRNFVDEAVVPPPLYSSSESLLQATEHSIIINSTN
jgi:hypothetical protein